MSVHETFELITSELSQCSNHAFSLRPSIDFSKRPLTVSSKLTYPFTHCLESLERMSHGWPLKDRDKKQASFLGQLIGLHVGVAVLTGQNQQAPTTSNKHQSPPLSSRICFVKLKRKTIPFLSATWEGKRVFYYFRRSKFRRAAVGGVRTCREVFGPTRPLNKPKL